MRISRDLALLVLLFAILAGLTAVLGVRQAEAEQAKKAYLPMSSLSVLPGGSLGLYKWLETLGYRPGRIEGDSFGIDPSARALLVLSTPEDYTPAEARAVREWVEQGNTLILCDEYVGSSTLWAEFDAHDGSPTIISGNFALEQPILGDRDFQVRASPRESLRMTRNDYVTYVSNLGEPLLVSFAQGKGQVWLCTVPEIMSNTGLKEDGNAALVSAMLSRVPRGGTVLFDEFHLEASRPTPSLQSLIARTPWGWALILAFVILFSFLVLNGRRFGRARPLEEELARRSPAEYVQSMARLFRRGDKRAMALAHYRRQLKRRLARPYGINPELPDDQFVEALARQRENLDRAALLHALSALDTRNIDERGLLRLAAQAATYRISPDRDDSQD